MSTTKTYNVVKAEVDYILRDIFQLDENDDIFQIIIRSETIEVE